MSPILREGAGAQVGSILRFAFDAASGKVYASLCGTLDNEIGIRKETDLKVDVRFVAGRVSVRSRLRIVSTEELNLLHATISL